MEVYKTKEFGRLARRERLDDAALAEAVRRVERGLIDATIARFLIKQRLARANQGRSGGLRAVVFYLEKERAVFLHLFAKNRKATLSAVEEAGYREFAKWLADTSFDQQRELIRLGEWIKVDYEQS